MIKSRDFREFIQLLNEHEIEYLIVGGYAVALYGYPRFTGDLDVWIRASILNAERIMTALRKFGFESLKISESDFTTPDSIVQLGYPPVRIDILTSLDGVEFESCFASRHRVVFEGLPINFISIADLKLNKEASGRTRDIDDLENLSEIRSQ